MSSSSSMRRRESAPGSRLGALVPRSRRSRSRPTGRRSRPAPTARPSMCGTDEPDALEVSTARMTAPRASPSRPTAGRSQPAAATGRSRSGTRRAGSYGVISPATCTRSPPSPSRRTGSGSPRRRRRGRSGSAPRPRWTKVPSSAGEAGPLSAFSPDGVTLRACDSDGVVRAFALPEALGVRGRRSSSADYSIPPPSRGRARSSLARSKDIPSRSGTPRRERSSPRSPEDGAVASRPTRGRSPLGAWAMSRSTRPERGVRLAATARSAARRHGGRGLDVRGDRGDGGLLGRGRSLADGRDVPPQARRRVVRRPLDGRLARRPRDRRGNRVVGGPHRLAAERRARPHPRRAGVEVSSVAYSEDGARLACGAEDGGIHVWDRSTWKVVKGLNVGVGHGVVTLAWPPSGHDELAAACSDDKVASSTWGAAT